jgi:hypothetical protein
MSIGRVHIFVYLGIMEARYKKEREKEKENEQSFMMDSMTRI